MIQEKKTIGKIASLWGLCLLCLCIVFCLLADMPVEAAETLTSGDWEYEILEDGTVEITKYKGKETEVVIPEMIEGKSVTSIRERAFLQCSSLTSIEILSGVTSIGSSAFLQCSSLTSIEIPSGVMSIGNSAFAGCSSLTSIEIPSGVTSIENSAFSGCSSLTSIEIPSGVTSIGSSAFAMCSSLTSIEIPSGVTSIGRRAFSGCSSLTSIEIPSGVTSIGSGAFLGCSSLTSIEIPSSVTSIGEGAFEGCSNLTIINDINNATISLNKNEYQYTGNEICPSLTVKYNDKILEKDVDYSLEYTNNISIGTAKVIISGIGRYFGEKELSFTIKEHELVDSEISLNKDSFTYTGKEVKANLKIVVAGHELTENMDYTLKYSNNVNAGNAKVVITGIGKFTGSVEKTYNITITATDLTIQKGNDPTYTGKRVYPTLDVKWGDVLLTEGIDYSVSDSSGYKNIDIGNGSIDIIFKGNYTGSKSVTFTISSVSLKSVSVEKSSYGYTGSALKPAVTVKDSNGKNVSPANYSIVYKNNVKNGTATVSVTGKNNFKGTVKTTFKIVPTVKTSSVSVYVGTNKKITVKSSDKISYSTSNRSIATVDSKGAIVGKKKGSAKITVKTGGRKFTVKVTVKNPSISAKNSSVYSGDTYKLSVNGGSGAVKWKSSNTSVATVKGGKITTKKPGSVTIKAVRNGVTMSCKVKVKKSSISKKRISLYTGYSDILSVKGISGNPKWKSSNPKVATVNSKGVVKGVKEGTANITATYGGVSYTCKVTVKKITYGSVSGNISWYYNDYQGNKPDTGAIVCLIPTSGSAKSMPTMSSYVEWELAYSMKEYQKYGVYMTKVDGIGNYKFNHIPTGEYKIVIISKNTTSGMAFDDREAYSSRIAGWISPYINKTNAGYLGECCGYQKAISDTIDVYENEDTYFSYDFGITYI